MGCRRPTFPQDLSVWMSRAGTRKGFGAFGYSAHGRLSQRLSTMWAEEKVCRWHQDLSVTIFLRPRSRSTS